MKRRTKTDRKRQQKREARRAAQFRSMGDSRYARKVKAGQFYGPMPKIPKYPDFRPSFLVHQLED